MLPYLRDRPLSMARYPDGHQRRADLPEERGPALPGLDRRGPRSDKEGGDAVPGALREAGRPGVPGQPGRASSCTRCSAGLGHLHRAGPADLRPGPAGRRPVRRRAHGARCGCARSSTGDLGLTCFVKTHRQQGAARPGPAEQPGGLRHRARVRPPGVAEVLAAAEPGPGHHRAAQGRPGRRASTRTSCATATRRPRSRRTRSGPAPARRWRCRCTGTRSPTRPLQPDGVTVRSIGARLERLGSDGDPWAGMSRHRYGLARPRRLLAGLAPRRLGNRPPRHPGRAARPERTRMTIGDLLDRRVRPDPRGRARTARTG